MIEKAVFVGREEVSFYKRYKYQYDIEILSEELMNYSFDCIYIPSNMDMSTFVLYLMRDFNLTKNYKSEYPHKVIYTDIFSYEWI